MIVFPFVIQEQLSTYSFCKILGWSILIQSFAKVIMGETALLGNAIICRKLPFKYIYYVCETIDD